jgi:serine protease
MLDAGAAVAAVLGLRASIAVSPAAPQAGQTVTLDSSGSTVASGRSVTSRQWELVDGGGITTGFAGPSNGAAATIVPAAAGGFTVRLTITDNLGVAVSAQQTVSATAAPAGAVVPSSGGGGGGAMSWAWLMGLAVAALRLRRRP